MMVKVRTLQAFQNDLQDGMTIEDACTKHQISFKYACDNMGKIYKKKILPKKASCTFASEYIQTRNGKYFLRKYLNGSTKMFGTYNSLSDAVRMREHCKEYGWKQSKVDEYCQELGIERVISSKSKVRYH